MVSLETTTGGRQLLDPTSWSEAGIKGRSEISLLPAPQQPLLLSPSPLDRISFLFSSLTVGLVVMC